MNAVARTRPSKASAELEQLRAEVERLRRRERARPPALRLQGLTVRFGGVTAVDDLTLDFPSGAVIGIIGPNGAGKTTLFDAIGGYVPSTGTIELDGMRIDHLAPNRRARAGLGRSFQDGRMFPSLTVAEALAVAFERQMPAVGILNSALRLGQSWRVERQIAHEVDDLVALMGLEAYANKFLDELSTGTRRIVDLAASLAHRPSLLLLDEPSSGIAQKETEALAPLLLRIREQLGCTLLLIEHDMPLTTQVSDLLVAMDAGALVTMGAPEEVLGDHRVIESYLGVDERAVNRSGTTAQRGARKAT
jgi:branched-chain amino acid transport system ATP-binding protein